MENKIKYPTSLDMVKNFFKEGGKCFIYKGVSHAINGKDYKMASNNPNKTPKQSKPKPVKK